MVNKKETNQTEKLHKHHYIRTPIAALFGIISLVLVIVFVLLAWANRTITDTNTYVGTVAPLIQKPEVQNFLATELSKNISEEAPINDLAEQLLRQNEIYGKTVDQLRPLVEQSIKQEALSVVSSPDFAKFWEESNHSIHQSLISQLNSNTNKIEIDFTQVLNDALLQLEKTKLSPIKDEIKIEPGQAVLKIEGSDITRVHNIYNNFKKSVYFLLLLVVVTLVASVIISVHHIKTLRRILLTSGILLLLIYGLLKIPAYVTLSSNPDTSNLAKALSQQIFANLQATLLIMSIVLIAVPIIWKVVEKIKK